MTMNLLLSTLFIMITSVNYGQVVANSDSNPKKTVTSMELLFEMDETSSTDRQNDEQCFDKSMEQWFQSFFLLQNEGYDMKQADLIAYKDAKGTHQMCAIAATGRRRNVTNRHTKRWRH